MNSSSTTGQEHVVSKTEERAIKKEEEVTVKLEPLECLVCAARSSDALELEGARTAAGTALRAFLRRFTCAEPLPPPGAARHLCRACLDLVNVLEQAEIDYLKLKETFESLLSKNPLFDSSIASPTTLPSVKKELLQVSRDEDSEDEPLARTKRKHGKGVKKKKKTSATGKKQKNSSSDKYSWECDECGMQAEEGGPVALAAHKITEHSLNEEVDIKTEDSNDIDAERSQSPYNNGIENGSEAAFGDFEDDDADSNFNPEEFLLEPRKKVKARAGFKRPKVWHSCDHCNARYSSLARLTAHSAKHDGSKPPYICEVCGAHYKHKRACDIHIALHKGISDWKCEECNKLFPSKNALQRHNNIHTGKLNYQCDLCGKSFIHTSSFKMHKLSHSGVKPHACDVCGLALMTRSHLKRHKRIHSGEKRHECHVCGKRFSERYNLAAHGKSHEAPAPAPGAAAASVDPQPRRRLFRCHFCTERFERRYMLERHMSVLHGRTLERPPPTPRNTMSKLLKAQAQARHHSPHAEGDSKDSSSEPRAPAPAPLSAVPPSKLLAQLTSQSPSLIAGSWAAAGPYAEVAYSQP